MIGLRETHGLCREAFVRTGTSYEGLHKRDFIIKTHAHKAPGHKQNMMDGWMVIFFFVSGAGPGPHKGGLHKGEGLRKYVVREMA